MFILKDKIIDEDIRDKVGVISIKKQICDSISMGREDAQMLQCRGMRGQRLLRDGFKRGRNRTKKYWEEKVRQGVT